MNVQRMRSLTGLLLVSLLACAGLADSGQPVQGGQGRPAGNAEPTDEQLFEQLVTIQDSSYPFVRNMLLARGPAIDPLLNREMEGQDWRRNLAARALWLRLHEPELVAMWELVKDGGLVTDPGDQNPRLEKRNPHGGQIKMPLTRQIVPLVVERLWEKSEAQGIWWRGGDVKAVRMLGHIGDPLAVEPLVVYLERHYQFADETAEALFRIGKPAVPELIAFLKRVTREGKVWCHSDAAWRAIDLLGRLGDPRAVPILKAILANTAPLTRDDNRWLWSVLAATAAKSLAVLAPQETAEPAVDWLLAVFDEKRCDRDYLRSYGTRHYMNFRPVAVGLGPAVLPLLKERLAAATDPRLRMTLEGLTAQIAAADKTAAYLARFPAVEQAVAAEVPVPGDDLRPVALAILKERAAVIAMPRHVVALGRERVEGVFPFLSQCVEWHWSDAAAIEALGYLGDERAVEKLAEVARGAYGPNRPAVVALFRIGGPKALAALKQAAAGGEAKVPQSAQAARRLAGTFALALEGKLDELAGMLGDEARDVRLVAAEALARAGDARAAPVLIQLAAESANEEHADLRGLLVSLGEKALPAVREARADQDDWPVRLTAEAAELEITNPELCRKVRDELVSAWAGFAMMHVYRVGMVMQAGEIAAKALPAEAVPYLEALAYFGGDGRAFPAVAVAAAGWFKQERSIPVIVACAGRPAYLLRDAVVEALKLFGEKGLEAAKAIPEPDPEKAGYSRRSGRSRAGTHVLADAKTPEGRDEILKGLRSTWKVEGEEDKQQEAERFRAWQERVLALIRAARNYQDEQLLDALIEFSARPEVGTYDEFRRELTRQLDRYEDDRVVAPLRQLALARTDQALSALTRRDGLGTVAWLAGLLAEGETVDAQYRAAQDLAAAARIHAPANKMREAVRRAAVRALVQALADPDAGVQWHAAGGLTGFQEPEAVKAVIEWFSPVDTKQVDLVCGYLGDSGDASACPKLLEALGRRPTRRLAEALLKLGREEAVPAMATFLGDGQGCGQAALALIRFGPQGLEPVIDVLRQTRDKRVWQGLLQVIAESTDVGPAYEAVAERLADIRRAGPEGPMFQALEARDREQSWRWLNSIAMKALMRCDAARAAPVLRRIVVEESDPTIRKEAIDLLISPPR